MKMFVYSMLLLILGISDTAACIGGGGGCTSMITINTTNIGLLMFILSMVLCLTYSAMNFYCCYKQKKIYDRCIVAGIFSLILFVCHLSICWNCGLLDTYCRREDVADIGGFLAIAVLIISLFSLYLLVCFFIFWKKFRNEISEQKAVYRKYIMLMACFLCTEILIGTAVYITTDYKIETACTYPDCM